MRILQADSPINWNHPLNSGLVCELCALPQPHNRTGFGTRFWFDLGPKSYQFTMTGGPSFTGRMPPSNLWGSLELTAASSQYTGIAQAPVTAMPLTAVVWARYTAAPNGNGMFLIQKTGGGVQHRFGLSVTSTNVLRVQTNDTSGTSDNGTKTLSQGVWYQFAGVWSSATSRTGYVNAVQDVSGSTSRTPVGVDLMRCGTDRESGTPVFWQGNIASVSVYNRALRPGEIQALYLEQLRGNPTRYSWVQTDPAVFAAPATDPVGRLVEISQAVKLSSTW